jgi:AcrR family transcriptional regulator
MDDAIEKPPVGRRAAQKEERRKAIVAVAARSFLDHGYAATTMSAISAALGGSKGTLWSYFSSKEELFAAVIEEASSVFRVELYPVLDQSNALAPTLETFCLHFLEKIASPDTLALYRLIVGESGHFPEVGRIFYERAARNTELALQSFLSQQMATGRLRVADPALAAGALMCLCQAGCYRAVLWRSERPAEGVLARDAAFAVATFLLAYSP